MSKIAVITDSTAYLPDSLLKSYAINVIPLLIIWDKETLRDGVDITPEQFYLRLEKSPTIPTTSQPSPADFKNLYDRVLEEGFEILAIVISSKLSGTMESAIQAKAMLPGAPIEIFDSQSTAMGMGFQVLAACRAIQKGATLKEALTVLENARQNSGVVFLVDTLKYLHLGGRIGGASRYLGNALNIKPILNLSDGRIEPLERVRTRAKALARIVDIVAERAGGRPIHIAAMHANAPEEGLALMEEAQKRMNVVEAFNSEISPVLGVHAGPRATGLTYLVE